MSILAPWYVFQPRALIRRVGLHFYSRDQKAIIKLPFGPVIEVDSKRTMGKALLHNGTHELAMAEVVFRLSRGRFLTIDVGANIGFVTLVMATAIDVNGLCHAFEPITELFDRLRENCGSRLNPQIAKRISCNQAAVSDANGFAHIHSPIDENEGLATLEPMEGPSEDEEVRTVTLDTFFKDSKEIRLLKIDVEGHELQVLKGAMNLLSARNIKNIVFEDHVGADSEVCRFLESFGYSVFYIDRSFFGPKITESRRAKIRAASASNWLATLSIEECRSLLTGKGWRVLGI